ncbi:MAG: alpha-ribazole phosphatase [Rhodomicrobium sp.]
MRAVLLIRHGEIPGDAAHRFIGHTDLPMSANGEAQIRELATRLNGRMTPDAIYCSDLVRSRRTAELLADGRAIPLDIKPELREINLGAWEGLSRRDVAEDQPDEYERRGRDIENFRPPGGESFADLAMRVLKFWESLAAENAETTIAIAAHAGVNRVILCHVLGMPLRNLFRLAQPPGCLNVIHWKRDGPTVHLLGATSI